MKTFIYDGTTENFLKLRELVANDVKILCPKCNTELIVALDIEAAGKHNVHPGVYCPENGKHMKQIVEIKKIKLKDLFGDPEST